MHTVLVIDYKNVQLSLILHHNKKTKQYYQFCKPMAKIILDHDPELTKEGILHALKEHFLTEGYEIDYSKLIGADVYIRKSAWVGVTIKLKQKPDSTFLRVRGYMPSPMARVMANGLLPMLILWPKWNKLIAEVKQFFEYDYQKTNDSIFR